ncbi:BZ3500_MvSof-1268-A1-R1_Chr2-1g04454 [Microbotryum saponariae]|uniref:BZ3500_MvSof-1268-A1-R1_Chr2-1g04454 protein n=1 Tax=Microbotryum saponariae TaxID=289078 RepID=A0A2X0L7F6_9BASI|nr:BZ3500_MvSof-1268-A1-R1_Chr2-1g04454 [Microbotryum saponariae]SCZ91753.1 BZ3501_MvSof-1269-A2-R1_Chr2-1g04110 [Microbotryum saponariae]
MGDVSDSLPNGAGVEKVSNPVVEVTLSPSSPCTAGDDIPSSSSSSSSSASTQPSTPIAVGPAAASETASPLNPTELFLDATRGFDSLLNNQLGEGKRIFERYPDSAAHNVGQGIAVFLQAALGQEDQALYGALNALMKAETLSTKEVNAKRSVGAGVYAPGLEYKALVSDAVMSQALCHVLTESYVEFMKAIYKLNRAYKGFKSLYTVGLVSEAVSESDSLEYIFTKLNSNYLAKTQGAQTSSTPGRLTPNGASTPTSATTPASSTSSSSSLSFFGSWGRKRADPNAAAIVDVPSNLLRHSSSAVTLPSQISKLGITEEKPNIKITTSTPASNLASRSASFENLKGQRIEQGVDGSHPAPLWKDDPITSLVIGGAAFGYGLFGLIFSLLPPKLRKLISWFGFGNSNRSAALKLLTVAASTGNDTHAAFASLTLLTFYCVVLLMSGWQSDEEYLLSQCEIVLERVIERFPEGTLWILQRAKIARMRHDVHTAIQVLETSLSKGSSFREADSLLQFELGWCLLSDGRFVATADSFERMCELNSWSHSTYVAIAAGALVDDRRLTGGSEEKDQRIEAAFKRLEDLLVGGKSKRMMGEPPTTETFLNRRLNSYKAKHARWIEEGRLPKTSSYWEAVRMTSAMELGFVWATIGGRSPPAAIKAQIDYLASLTPSPAFGPHAQHPASPSPLRRCSTSDDLDTLDEIATRSLLLGALYRSLDDGPSLHIAREFLQSITKHKEGIKEEKWVPSFALFELAVVECKECELETRRLEKEGVKRKVVVGRWKDGLGKAEKLIENLFASGEYDLKSRLESRTMQLRDEIAAKKKKLGI